MNTTTVWSRCRERRTAPELEEFTALLTVGEDAISGLLSQNMLKGTTAAEVITVAKLSTRYCVA